MLSGLPDDVLRHILSFLPTKTSVSTSVLAKRWRFLWAHVPNLEFYEHDFRGGSEAQPLDIINSVTMLHEAKTVNTFSFRLYNVKVCAIQLETLINFFIERSVKNLSLEFYYKFWRDIVFIVPSLLFTCKTLVDLKLVKCGVIPSSGDFFLPSLKKLNLWYVEYESDESLPNLLSGCPLLEELSIHDDFSMGVKGQKYSGRIIVSSLTIKILIVDFSLGYIDREDMLIIDVPALIYLKVNRCHLDWVKCLSKTMACLIEADIFLNGDLHTSALLEFRSILCQARQLKISNVHGEMVNNIKGTGSMMKFVNLIKLELNMTVDWYVLAELLESSDNLEVLNFRLGGCFRYKEPERVPLFLLSRLRNVHVIVNNCLSYEVVFDTVRYILRNARVLERMKISHLRSRFSGTEKLDVLQRISLFERVSKSCQVSFNTAMEYDA